MLKPVGEQIAASIVASPFLAAPTTLNNLPSVFSSSFQLVTKAPDFLVAPRILAWWPIVILFLAGACASNKDEEEETPAPSFRTRPPKDLDKDGIPDEKDKCPTEAASNTSGGCPIEDPTSPENGPPPSDAERDMGVRDAIADRSPNQDPDAGVDDGSKPDGQPAVDQDVDQRDIKTPRPDASDAVVQDAVGADAADSSVDRRGVNDHYADLAFCSGRNVFIVREDEIIGACGDKPAKLYRVPLLADVSENAVAEPILNLPIEIGDRDVLPLGVRPAALPNFVVLPMMHPDPASDTAATAVIVDTTQGQIVELIIDATELQIGTAEIGEPIPINGMQDLSWFSGAGRYVGITSNPNQRVAGEEGLTYRFGLVFDLPRTERGLPDTGIEPIERVIRQILSNRQIGVGQTVEPGDHFSFQTSTDRPTQLFSLGSNAQGVEQIGIQNSGFGDSPASIDILDAGSHQIVRSVVLGDRQLMGIPPAVDVDGRKIYTVALDGRTILEVDGSEGTPEVQENVIHLDENLQGEVASIVFSNGQLVIGEAGGRVLFVEYQEEEWRVVRNIPIGDGVHQVSVDPATGNVFVATGSSIVSID